MKIFFSSILFLLSFCAQAQIDKIVPSRPSVSEGLIYDNTGTLTGPQKQALNQKLIAFDDSTSSQVAIVIINSLEGNDISDFGIAVGRKWGIGGKEFSNGIIIVVAKADRKMRIEVGYGLEGAIPDITAKSIIDNSLTPAFKEGNYYRGLDNATDDIIRAAAGEYKAPAGSKKKSKGGWLSIVGTLILILVIGAISGGGRGTGGSMSGAGWIIGSMLGSSSRGSGWSGGGSSSGGGFGGFGGGSFGGGGASGSW